MQSWTLHVLYTSNLKTADSVEANSPVSEDCRRQLNDFRHRSEPSLGAGYNRTCFYVISPRNECHWYPLLSVYTTASLNEPRCTLSTFSFVCVKTALWWQRHLVSKGLLRGNLIHWHKAHVKHLVQCLALSRGLWSAFRMQPNTPRTGILTPGPPKPMPRLPRLRRPQGLMCVFPDDRQNAVGHSASIRLKTWAFQNLSETSSLPLMEGTAETQGMIITSERKKKKNTGSQNTRTRAPTDKTGL